MISVTFSYSRIRIVLYCSYHMLHINDLRPTGYLCYTSQYIVIADYGLVTINEGSEDSSRSTYIYIINKPKRCGRGGEVYVYTQHRHV